MPALIAVAGIHVWRYLRLAHARGRSRADVAEICLSKTRELAWGVHAARRVKNRKEQLAPVHLSMKRTACQRHASPIQTAFLLLFKSCQSDRRISLREAGSGPEGPAPGISGAHSSRRLVGRACCTAHEPRLPSAAVAIRLIRPVREVRTV